MIVMYGGKIMEQGPSADIMANPRHPYTKALLASTPRFGMHYTGSRLMSIPGKVSDPSRMDDGCPFAPRCKFAKEECRIPLKTCYKMTESGGN